ncbi:MAG: hypothetical protein J6U97_00160 [Bacteroidaceae bacterium]|nr:hypothetical protein [Bacteroidaceae bacterium]
MSIYDSQTGKSDLAVDDLSMFNRGKTAEELFSSGSGFTPTDAQLAAMNSGITSAGVAQINTNKNNILSDYGGTIGKNILNTKIILGEGNDLTATLNDDKSITVNGTNQYDSASVPFLLGVFTPVVGKTYVCKGTGNANIRINVFDGVSLVCASSDDATFTAEAGKSYLASVWVAAKPESGTQFNNTTIYPMICEQTIYTADSSYQPYILSNREASDTIQAIQQTIGDINSVLEEVL